MFTSPHLQQVRERIRINGAPLSEQLFAKYYYEVFDKLLQRHDKMPTYFRFLTLMALHVFIKERVHCAVMEVGIGGRYDSTNILQLPRVCGVTSIGLDHQAILGHTVEEIAWHKAGIMKSQVPCLPAQQCSETVHEVLSKEAEAV